MSYNQIDLAYDSHVHFFGVGIPAVQWRILEDDTELKLPDNLKDQQLIKGFGWSNKMPLSEFTNLTSSYPDKHFCLSYFDGHSSFISKNLLEDIGHKLLDNQNHKSLKTGVIVGEVERDKILAHIPKDNALELRKMALYAQDVFIKNEFNRVRHLTARKDHWSCLKQLETENLLKLKIEVFFSEFMGQSLDEAIQSFNNLQKQSSDRVSASGIKLFYDGAFGSNTAYTSVPGTVTPRFTRDSLKEKMIKIFEQTKASVAVHTIGDLALEDVIKTYREICSEQSDAPALHLEHAPIFSKNILSLLDKEKLNCVFHFQPSHWISDHLWYAEYKDKLQEHEIYPFKFLFNNSYKFHFGSDAPVINCSKNLTLEGLQLIENDRAAST